MSLRVVCPKCKRRSDVPDSQAGKALRCPACQQLFLVPAPQVTPVAQPVKSAGPVEIALPVDELPLVDLIEDAPVKPVSAARGSAGPAAAAPRRAGREPFNFRVRVTGDSKGALNGSGQATWSDSGLRLSAGDSAPVLLPIGIQAAWLGGNKLKLTQDSRQLYLSVTSLSHYQQRLSRDLADCLSGMKPPDLVERDYRIPTYMHALAAAPLGVALLGLNLVWLVVALGLVAACFFVARREYWEQPFRLRVAGSLVAGGYLLLVLALIMSPASESSADDSGAAVVDNTDRTRPKQDKPPANDDDDDQRELQIERPRRRQYRVIREFARPTPRISNQLLAQTIAPDSGSAWVSRLDQKLERITVPDFKTSGVYAVPKWTYGMALDGRGILYTAAQRAPGKASDGPKLLGLADIDIYDTNKITGDTLQPVNSLTVGGVLVELCLSPDDAYLYYLDSHNRKIGRVDLARQKIDRESPELIRDTRAMCLSADGKKLYTCSEDENTVQVLDPATLKVEKSIKLKEGGPKNLQATNTGHVFLNGGRGINGRIYLLDATRDYGDAPAPVMEWAKVYSTNAVALSHDQRTLFASCFHLSPGSVEGFHVQKQPHFHEGISVGRVSVEANFATRGMMAVSRNGAFLIVDRGAIIWLDR
ncbi:MAG: hypothetical protein AB7K24_16900 [Gemmataceae bacterium]